jgi:hypothetical protein
MHLWPNDPPAAFKLALKLACAPCWLLCLPELVVAPAGYSLKARIPAALAAYTSSGGVLSVRYSVMRGVKEEPGGRADRIRCLYSNACNSRSGQGRGEGQPGREREMGGGELPYRQVPDRCNWGTLWLTSAKC